MSLIFSLLVDYGQNTALILKFEMPNHCLRFHFYGFVQYMDSFDLPVYMPLRQKDIFLL